MIRVFIDGREGTTGLRIVERLSSRNDIELININEALRKDISERAKCINEADVAFLCLPDPAAREIADKCADSGTVIIDASTAHRTNDNWAYGFPELSPEFKEKIKKSNRIAVPGCYASGFVSIAFPLIKDGLAPSDYPFSCFGVSGYSGGGKKMIAQYQADTMPEGFDSPRLYGLTLNHKHVPEMKIIPGLAFSPVFSPMVCSYYSGMSVTVPLQSRLLPGSPSADKIRTAFKKHYEGMSFVRVMDTDDMKFLDESGIAGRDYMEIYVFGNRDMIQITSRFDNLGKGASGAAVQCMNISCGLNEAAGLTI